jgi:hypothetical protein
MNGPNFARIHGCSWRRLLACANFFISKERKRQAVSPGMARAKLDYANAARKS